MAVTKRIEISTKTDVPNAQTALELGSSAYKDTDFFAPADQGVLGGNTHAHNKGDGAQINHLDLYNIGHYAHTQIDAHIDATANVHGITFNSSEINSAISKQHDQNTDVGSNQGQFYIGGSDTNAIRIKHNVGTCEIRNGYDSDYADLRCKNLYVTGSQTTIQSENINLADNIITLNSNFTTGQPVENAGIEVARGDVTKSSLIWDESVDLWKCGLSGSEVEISLLGHDHATITGNAATASKLQSARVIALSGDVQGSTAFDGSANVTINVISYQSQKLTTARSISLTGDATGTTAFDGSANVSIPVTILTAKKLTTPRTITINGDLNGATAFDGSSNVVITCNVVNAGKLTTARQIALAGDVTGSVMFDGSSNVTLNVTGGSTSKLTTARNIAISGAVSGSANFDGSANINISTTLTTHYHANDTLVNIDWSKILNVPMTPNNAANYICQRDGNGDVWARYFRGTATTTLWADLAEMYSANTELLNVGQVVLVAKESGADCELSNEEASNRILGVVSKRPGVVLRDGLPKGIAIMRTGLGPCQVQGPVTKGEPLVSGLGGTAIGITAFKKRNPNADLTFCLIGRANETIEGNGIKLIDIIM